MKKILRYLLLVLCLISSVKLNVNAAENTYTLVKLTGITNVKIYTSDVKKVSVKDGKMEFTLKEGGHYFIAKRALASSLDESTDAEKQEIQDASDAAEDVPWDASEETVVLGNGDDTDTGATTAEKKTAMVRWGLIGLIALVCCGAIGVVVYNKRKEKGKPDLSKEKDRKDGGK